MDEVHFQQHGSRCRMWVPPELKDPVVLHHPTRKSVGYFGAVRLRDGKFVAQQEPARFDAQTTWAFLRRLRQASRRAERQVLLVTDNAKYHHACLHAPWRAAQEPDFLVAFLPPLQSGAQSDRTRLETGPAALSAQPLLPRPGAGVGGGGRAFRPVGARQSGPGETVCGCLRCASTYDAVYKSRLTQCGVGPADEKS